MRKYKKKKRYKIMTIGKSKQLLVVKSNDLNQAHYRLTISEQRVILMMVSMIQPGDEDFHIYRIKVSDFLKLLGVKNQQMYSEVKKITKSLIEKVLTIKRPRSELQLSWFSSAEYFDGEGYVELCFDPKLKPYLLGLKECFVQYQLKNVIKLKSSYSIRMYELLKQYEKLGRKSYSIEELKPVLGIKPDEYVLYKHFKTRIITRAQEELKAGTDIAFEFKEMKTGRKVTSLEFFITTNKVSKDKLLDMSIVKSNEMERSIASMKDTERELFETLQNYYQLSREQACAVVTEVLPEKGHQYVIDLLDYCREYCQQRIKQGIKCRIGAITSSAFKKGWQTQPSLFDKEIKAKELQKIKEQQQERKRMEEERLQFKQIKDRTDEILNTMSDNEIKIEFPAWLEENRKYFYDTFYKPGMDIQRIRAGNLRTPLREYIEEKYL
ncbi:MAG: replication initiation protein [Nitrospirae bacterium YQR-1]